MESIRTVFGKNVQKYRLRMKWSQAELAEKLDISTAFMTHIEHGTRGVSMETIELIARCFGVPYAVLFEDDAKKDRTINYISIFTELENDLKERINTQIETSLKKAKRKV